MDSPFKDLWQKTFVNPRNIPRETSLERSIKKINAFRIFNGLRPIIPEKRKCLCCDKEFTAYGANNKLCGNHKEE